MVHHRRRCVGSLGTGPAARRRPWHKNGQIAPQRTVLTSGGRPLVALLLLLPIAMALTAGCGRPALMPTPNLRAPMREPSPCPTRKGLACSEPNGLNTSGNAGVNGARRSGKGSRTSAKTPVNGVRTNGKGRGIVIDRMGRRDVLSVTPARVAQTCRAAEVKVATALLTDPGMCALCPSAARGP